MGSMFLLLGRETGLISEGGHRIFKSRKMLILRFSQYYLFVFFGPSHERSPDSLVLSLIFFLLLDFLRRIKIALDRGLQFKHRGSVLFTGLP